MFLNNLHAEKFMNFLLSVDFFKISFTNTIRLSSSLDPDQARHFVWPELGPNCLQSLSADSTGNR